MNMFKTMLIGCMLLVTSVAQAGFSQTDWLVAGDNKATIHEETGIEWLKLTETTGLSVNQVLEQTGAGETYEGWRIPTAQEIVGYWEGIFAGSSVLENQQGTVTDYYHYSVQAQRWVTFNGTQTTSPIRSYGLGYGLDGDVSFFGVSRSPSNTRYRNAAYTYDENSTNSLMGIFLVSDGGTTLSSQLDPSINQNNVNYTDAPVTFVGLLSFLGLGLIRLRKRTC
jgi:hypothetical protein